MIDAFLRWCCWWSLHVDDARKKDVFSAKHLFLWLKTRHNLLLETLVFVWVLKNMDENNAGLLWRGCWNKPVVEAVVDSEVDRIPGWVSEDGQNNHLLEEVVELFGERDETWDQRSWLKQQRHFPRQEPIYFYLQEYIIQIIICFWQRTCWCKSSRCDRCTFKNQYSCLHLFQTHHDQQQTKYVQQYTYSDRWRFIRKSTNY